MEGDCYAAIDIGSNAVRLLIKREERSGALDKALLLRVPLRLGFDVFPKGEISKKKSANLVRLMKAYAQLMKIYDVSVYRACATSAMRDASNGPDIIRKVRKETGIDIEIIDGRQEARMIYNNHMECTEDRNGNYVYVDVGGGSTEINLMVRGELVSSGSYDIGTVRMLSGKVLPDAWRRLESDIAALRERYGAINIIGSGGNINRLYRMAESEGAARGQMLGIDSLEELYGRLSPLSPQERMERFGLKADRADVIVPAATIFLTIARLTDADHIYVPVRGLADGMIDSMYAARRATGDVPGE